MAYRPIYLSVVLLLTGCSANPEDSPLADLIPAIAELSGNYGAAAQARANVQSAREERAQQSDAAAEREAALEAKREAFREAEAIPGHAVEDDDFETAYDCYREIILEQRNVLMDDLQVAHFRNLCKNRKIGVFWYCGAHDDETSPVYYTEADPMTNDAARCSKGEYFTLAHVSFIMWPPKDDYTEWFARVPK
jgi:hypothetical protein